MTNKKMHSEHPNTEDGGIRRLAAGLLVDKKVNTIILCNTEEDMKYVWKKLSPEKIDMKYVIGVIYKDDNKPGKLVQPTKPIKEIEEKKEEKEVTFYWYYDRERDKCFICPAPNRNNCRKLGIAKRKTETECKILLRDVFKWSKEDIEEVGISLKIVDDIPF